MSNPRYFNEQFLRLTITMEKEERTSECKLRFRFKAKIVEQGSGAEENTAVLLALLLIVAWRDAAGCGAVQFSTFFRDVIF